MPRRDPNARAARSAASCADVAIAAIWPVLTFVRPVALKPHFTLPPARPTLAALAVGGAVAAGSVLWANHRRRHVG